MTDTEIFFDLLFEKNEIMEIRLKHEDDKFATKTFVQKTPKRVHGLIERSFPVWEANEKNVWVGVCPRPEKGSSAALHGRVLWVDLDDSIDSVDKARDALAKSGLPQPTLIVWSGYGVHFYWRLNNAHKPEELLPYSRGVHEALPSDNTHDPTRVMRVPGTANPKRGGTRKSVIIENTEARYDLHEFPQVKPVVYLDNRPVRQRSRTDLLPADRQALIDNFLPGQRHSMVLAISGYLRKDLAYPEDQAIETIMEISKAAGHPPDDKLLQDIADTYSTPWARVAGSSALYNLGVVLESAEPVVNFRPPKRATRSPRISIIDPNEHIEPQEFWVPGLIGPGLKTLWAAPGKTGKSFAVMQIGQAIATGSNLWDFGPATQQRVLYFQGELTRQMVMERANGLFGAGMVRDFQQYAMTDKPSEPLSLIENPEILYDAAENYDFIIVDPIAAFNDNDENSNNGVRDTLALFDPLTSAGKAVMIVHHTRKVDEGNANMNDVRGSGAWFNGVDAMAVQYRIKNSANTRVKFGYRAAPDRDELTLYRMTNGGFTDDHGLYERGLNLGGKLKVRVDPATLN
jgi:hypothetical protein